jgi:hypothetical protein
MGGTPLGSLIFSKWAARRWPFLIFEQMKINLIRRHEKDAI